jgi:GNAT superfamily N-acetyltransferase
VEIRTATTDAELEALLSVHNAVHPNDPLGLTEMRSWESQVKEMVMYVASEGDRPVGAGDAGLLIQSPEPFAHAWVLEEERRRGIGSALYETISQYARGHGKDALEVWVEDSQPDGVTFVRNRGFTEIGRELRVSLDLTAIAAPAVEAPEGITITTWAERPELIGGIYEVAVEAMADIPGDEEDEIEPFEDWVAHEMEAGPGDRKDATFVALAGDEVVGYSKFSLSDAQPTVAHHDLTGVKRAWRKRGIARALKQAQIAWAKREGFERLETRNEERNEPIRKLNAEFGYEPSGARILFRGPLVEVRTASGT